MGSRIDVVGKSKDRMHGAWISEGASDVHVYDQADMIVIGWNKDTESMRFTPIALCFGKSEGTSSVTIQVESAKGQDADPEYLEFSGAKLERLGQEIREFLKKAEQIARHG